MKNKILIILLSIAFLGHSQKINKAETSFKYTQLPLKPLSVETKSINATLELLYAEEIYKMLQDAEDEYQQNLLDHPQAVKDAKERYDERMLRYDKEMEAWKKTDIGTKFIEKQILKENNKPVKPGSFYPPAEPRIRNVSHEKLFDSEELIRSYLIIDGFTGGTENALKIKVKLHGFDSQEGDPVSKTVKKYNSSSKSYSNITVTTYPVSYKHPVSLKIETLEGEILHEGTFEETANWTQVSSKTYPNEIFYERLEEGIINTTMSKIKNYLNSQYGVSEKSTTLTIYTPSSKKLDYTDFQDAYYESSEGYELLVNDNSKGIEKLQKAISIWEKAMEESDVDDRKARVNAKVTKFTLWNLQRAYLWSNDFEKAKNALKKAYGTSPNKKEMKTQKSIRQKINDREERFNANN